MGSSLNIYQNLNFEKFLPSGKTQNIFTHFIYLYFKERQVGQRLNIIIVSEGAIDRDGKAITSDEIKQVSQMLWSFFVNFMIMGQTKI